MQQLLKAKLLDVYKKIFGSFQAMLMQAVVTRPGGKKILEVDPRQVIIHPKVVKLPGCFNIEIKNIRVLDNHGAIGNSLFAKVEYHYYCDICESLHHLQEESGKSALTDQLKGISCPKYPGFYTFRKEFCFNDWTAFDSNGDCQFDFFQGDKFSDYRSALSSLQQVGYGTVVAKLRLAANATDEIAGRKRIKETLIEENIRKELEERGKTWNIGNEQFEKFRLWYINYRKDTWHREEYLPWLLYENEISCIRVTFDVCQRVPKRNPFTAQSLLQFIASSVHRKFFIYTGSSTNQVSSSQKEKKNEKKVVPHRKFIWKSAICNETYMRITI
uniref:DUF7753 domain-containing protein n=1 Tax=Wuchereria bancrofti TaxID=6293 RepID=A0A1I8EI92_WUCBA